VLWHRLSHRHRAWTRTPLCAGHGWCRPQAYAGRRAGKNVSSSASPRQQARTQCLLHLVLCGVHGELPGRLARGRIGVVDTPLIIFELEPVSAEVPGETPGMSARKAGRKSAAKDAGEGRPISRPADTLARAHMSRRREMCEASTRRSPHGCGWFCPCACRLFKYEK
jgi:hypothetical protein